jgi:hypothetical protein
MIEVIKQLVEALEWCHGGEPIGTAEAIKAGKQAIAELESQEPVAWVAEDICKGQHIDGRPRKIWWECNKGVGMAFYTHPPPRTWVGLTDEEREKHRYDWHSNIHDKEFKAIEAKLKEKNT